MSLISTQLAAYALGTARPGPSVDAPRGPARAPFERIVDRVTFSEEVRRGAPAGADRLSESERARVRELRSRDREVRAHEQAHRRAAGTLVRGATRFQYETGPDGRRYAVGGEVEIDTGPVPGDPEATLVKAERIARAALAPAEPSPQDRRVAAEAAALAARARVELAREKRADAPGPAAGRLDRRV